MIVDAYDLHLYCDGPACPHRYDGPAGYVGRNQRDVFQQARKDGWTLRPAANRAYCSAKCRTEAKAIEER